MFFIFIKIFFIFNARRVLSIERKIFFMNVFRLHVLQLINRFDVIKNFFARFIDPTNSSFSSKSIIQINFSVSCFNEIRYIVVFESKYVIYVIETYCELFQMYNK